MSLLCYHYYGIFDILFYANNIATVLPLISYSYELWLNYSGGIIPFSDKNIEKVYYLIFLLY